MTEAATAVANRAPGKAPGTEAGEPRRSAEAAFTELYRSSRDDLFAYVAALLRDRSAAEEVTAAAFERAWRRRRQLDRRRGAPRAWLFGIARNAALDELRRRSRQAEQVEAARDEGADPGEIAIRNASLRAALSTLAPRERELIALKFFAGLANAEIAAAVGVSETNAGTRLHRAVEKLRRAMS